MNFQTITVESIEIAQFKKIRDFSFVPEKGANLFFGTFRSGKTSVCEFIQFALYGADSVALARDNAEDAHGKITVSADNRTFLLERSVIGGVESLTFLDAQTAQPVEIDTTPGEFFTGLDQETFDLVTYFKQARYETPVFKPGQWFLSAIASQSPETMRLYEEWSALNEANSEKNGALDLLREQKDKLQKQLDSRSALDEEVNSCNASLEEIDAKLDENDRRCVLLKADMAGHADDLKLSQNKENAEDLNRRIQANEKKLRIANYDVTNKIGKLTPEELDEMKGDYNRLSLSVTALNDARMALTAAEENLEFHEKLFAGKGNARNYSAEKKKIAKNKTLRMILQILAVLLVGIGVATALILHSMDFDLTVAIAAASATGILGIALFFLTSIFTFNIQKILKDSGKKSVVEFNEYLDRLNAHSKTTQLYRDQVKTERERCAKKGQETEEAQNVISQKIKKLGYTEEDGEVLAICDEIIEANDALYDLQALVEEEKEQYRKLLSKDVENQSLTVSPEFQALQKELAFLSVQNESLYKKKALLSSRLKSAKEQLEQDPEVLNEELKKLEEALKNEEAEYETIRLKLALENTKKENFENEIKARLQQSINEKLSFMLKPGESFLFDEVFELCFCDQKSVLPLMGAGGGMVSEMGLLAFRLSMAQMLKKNRLPMIFDDSLAMLAPDAAKDLYEVLCKTCGQFFLATSSRHILELCEGSAKIYELQ